jgi:3'(2'), 5'-bisphosphate nucleotidase
LDHVSRQELVNRLLHVAREAGATIMRHYAGTVSSRTKADLSPVTAADEEAEELILRYLGEIAPSIPVLAEESAAAGRIPDLASGTFFLVDPLDGTREFLDRNGEFTVNIALIEHGDPVAGVVYAPALGRIFYGWQTTAFEQKNATGPVQQISTRKPAQGAWRAVASRSHRDVATNRFLSHHGISDIVSAGSSLKFCLLASGEADVYPRMGPTMEWDTAAGHAVLLAAGGRVTLEDETTPLRYGKSDRGYRNPSFIAWGR